jgi:hypothetical protein
MKSWSQSLLLGAGFGATFLLGQLVPNVLGPRATLQAQGRGPVNPAPAPTAPPENKQPEVVYHEEGGQSASSNGFVAVSGSYGVGTSVLYLVDTVNRQLAVYEARGGSAEQRRVVFVGARRIDLDLQLHAYNDRSEYDHERLQELFDKRGRKDHDAKTGLDPKGRPDK